jgi:hypothetical protein
MSFNLTPPQQRFVVAIMNGLSQGEAYKAAKFPMRMKNGKPINRPVEQLTKDQLRKRGSEVASSPAVAHALVRARAAALEAVATKAAHTTQSLVQMLEEAYRVALASDPPQTSGAVAATLGISKLLGLYIDRKAVLVATAKPGLDNKAVELSESEWRAQFTPQREQLKGPKSSP